MMDECIEKIWSIKDEYHKRQKLERRASVLADLWKCQAVTESSGSSTSGSSEARCMGGMAMKLAGKPRKQACGIYGGSPLDPPSGAGVLAYKFGPLLGCRASGDSDARGA